ncbi:MAG: hypothetical protein CMN78_02380 [Spirochaetales bacterium]|nr:hypothetical protein [Spirochaetales bacterium]
MGPMNVIFIMSDQQRHDSIGPKRHPCADFPRMERLRSESVIFDNFFASAMACVPSRQAMLSGKQEWMSRSCGNWKFFMGEDTTWMSILRDNGYRCVSVGKTHMVHSGSFHIQVPVRSSFGNQTGWDHFHPSATPEPDETYFDIHTAHRACDSLKKLKGGDPFALFVGFHAPHEPYVMPERYLDFLKPADASLPENRSVEEYRQKSTSYRKRVEHFKNLFGDIDDEKIRIGIAGHHCLLKMLDDCLGILLDEIAALDLLEDTLIVYCSDHGDLLGEHMLFNKAATFYESEIRIPMMIRFPTGEHAGKSISRFGSGIDVLPTLLDILNIDLEVPLPGFSLLPAITEDKNIRPHVTTTIVDAMMIRTESEKLWYNVLEDDGEMYDLENDPGEMKNLYGNPGSLDLRRELFERMIQSRMRDDRVYSQPTVRERRLREEVSSSNEPET